MSTGPAVSLLVALQRVLLASSHSTSRESPTPTAPPLETPNHGAPPRLTPTMTTSQESVPGDIAMTIAPGLALGGYLLFNFSPEI